MFSLYARRAAYCRNAIAISLSIKNNFHRYLPSQGDTNIVQYIIPYPMPVHMTRASLPSLDKTGHLHAPENTNVCVAQMITPTPQPMGKRVDVAAPATPILPRRIKRPYNKKTPQRLSTHFTSQVGNFPSPCLNHQSAPSANQFAQMFSPSVHYARKPSILSPKTTTVAAEEASSDSGTDDDFFCGDPNILHFADGNSNNIRTLNV